MTLEVKLCNNPELEALDQRLALDPDLTKEMRATLMAFVAHLLKVNESMNLTRITDAPGLYEKQIRDSLQLVPYLREEAAKLSPDGRPRLLDLGTGAGFPGLILKIVCPEWEIVLLDSVRKKLDFLDASIEKLGIEGISTVHARAEDLGQDPGHRERYDLVTARAVAAFPTLAEYALPFVKCGGKFLALKTLDDPVEEAAFACRKLGGRIVGSKPYQNPCFDDPDVWIGDRLVVVSVEKFKTTPKRYPRKAGTPKRDPLR